MNNSEQKKLPHRNGGGYLLTHPGIKARMNVFVYEQCSSKADIRLRANICAGLPSIICLSIKCTN